MIKVTYIGHSSFLVEWPIIITKERYSIDE